MEGDVKMTPQNEVLIAGLNQILQLEYSLIIHYPQLARMLRDERAQKLATQLGDASLSHANAVSNAITKLGGTPSWSFEPLPNDDDMLRVFQKQLDKEKLALELHNRTASRIPGKFLKEEFSRIAKEEERHIKIVQDIISLLSEG